jgi:hypothetical protein
VSNGLATWYRGTTKQRLRMGKANRGSQISAGIYSESECRADSNAGLRSGDRCKPSDSQCHNHMLGQLVT